MTSERVAPAFTAARVERGHDIVPPEARRGHAIRTVMRSRTHHAKEALVVGRGEGPAWRLFSDEGDYFGGTDLAPPPLGLFSAGLASSYVAELTAMATRRGIPVDSLRVIEDSVYTTEGSALRGTIAGGALPISVRVEANTPDDTDLRTLAQEAIVASPVDGLLRRPLTGRFALYLNGKQIPTGSLAAIGGPSLDDPGDRFDQATDAMPPPEALVVKVADDAPGELPDARDARPRADGQARRPHARAVCAPRDDGLMVIDQHLFQPPGSHFRLLADSPAATDREPRAPDPMSYVSAGLAFCYATQVIRYAQLTKLRVDGCRLVQDLWLGSGDGEESAAEAPETHLFLDSPEDPDAAGRILAMGQRMCFLHALCATALGVEVTTARRSRTT